MPRASWGADLPEINHSRDARAQFEKHCAPARWSDFNAILHGIRLQMVEPEAAGLQKRLAYFIIAVDRQRAELKALERPLRDALASAAGGDGPLAQILREQDKGAAQIAGWAEMARREVEGSNGRKAELKHSLAVALARMLAEAGLTLERDKGKPWPVVYGLALDALGVKDSAEKNTLARAYKACCLNGWWSSEGRWIPR
ncbi:hypothetical protein EOE18_10385 [Novosphingobium umbonatum]|uniref:Uncharacterized protein n=1 Tax=Novosphingobium umbonatum TaxID=1908524 RepID=A0A3S2USI4_9SPHN|nr:hypothetical protein [Novosphingobium umbonatum]RVU05124.1 hypothetical protein EOE18_10385 [Novosphingobium umbonatum]